MSVSSVSSYTNQTLTDYLVSDKSKTEENAENGAVLSHARRNSAYGAYGANAQTGAGLQAMLKAVEEIKAQTGGPVTFDMVKEYRGDLEKEFTAAVQMGLTLLGVEESDDFQLRATSAGEVEILCDDPELKSKIEQLFEKSEGLKDQFLYIQALGNIERTKQVLNPKSEMMATRAELGARAVDIFLNAAANSGVGYSSLLGNYSDSSMQFMLGANFTV